MDCQKIDFSSKKSKMRMNKLASTFNRKDILRILAFALYLLGAKRQSIADFLGIPDDSIKTIIRVTTRDGIQALFDRRKSKAPVKIVSVKDKEQSEKKSIHFENDKYLYISVNKNNSKLKIPIENKVQVRTVLLSCLNSGLLKTHETAKILEISVSHCRKIAQNLNQHDVTGSLIDKRKGQQHDFRFGPNQKSELIRQFTARAITGHSVSSEKITELINEQTQSELSSRTIRWHIEKLGLAGIKISISDLVNSLKKKS